MMEAVVTTVKGQKITVMDVLTHMKTKGIYRSAIYEIIESRVVAFLFEDQKMKISPDEFSAKIMEKRKLSGISGESDFHRYLEYHGIIPEQLESFWKSQIQRDYLKNAVVLDEQVKKYFNANKERFTTAAVARVVSRSREAAERHVADIRSGERDFFQVARDHSIDDNTRFAGGYLGDIRRGYLAPEVEREIFSAQPGAVLGPFQENNIFTIYKVYAITSHKLSDHVRGLIRDQLFEEWIRKIVCAFPA